MPGDAKEYHCEDCKKFNEEEVPVDCLAGHGKVAFSRKACSDLILKVDPSLDSKGGES
jgi:hypothetical protein